MNASSSSPARPSELASGFLAVLSLVGSALALAYQPIKLIPFAILLALIAAAMAPRNSRLPLLAILFGALCFILGMTFAVLSGRALY